jgi:hypothetical protein
MKATVLWHAPVAGAPSGEVHRFGFALEDAIGARPYSGVISLRTARVLVAELTGNDGFISMLRAIVETLPADYDTLIGQHFDDGVDPQGPADLSNPSA